MNTDMNMDTMTVQRVNFIQAGYDVIPLVPASKSPLRKAWQKRPTVAQWYKAPADSNLGLRAGNGKAFIDCDDKNRPGTAENVLNWLTGLGYDRKTLPIVQTPTNGGVGRHIYVNFTGALLGSKRNFLTSIGAGDFRFGAAAFVATFPDFVTGLGEYKLLQGDIAHLPELDIKDIASLVDINAAGVEIKPSKRMSRLALAIMQGIKPERYTTASEGEMALVLSLHNSGFTYEEIKQVFKNNKCLGHYTDKHEVKGSQEAERWLYMTYKNAVTYSHNESRPRRQIAEWIVRAKVAAWNNVNDKNIFLGHLQIAHKAGRYEHYASVRDLSLFAGVTKGTASNSNKRLVENFHLLSVLKSGSGVTASEYVLESAKIEHILSNVCEDMSKNGTPQNEAIATHDAFSNGKGRLGRRAGEVYALLMFEPLTFKSINERTHTPERTLRRILRKLRNVKDRKTGEVLELVKLGSDGLYYGNLVDLDLVAAIYGTYGITGKRREEYEQDRKNNSRAWELSMLTK